MYVECARIYVSHHCSSLPPCSVQEAHSIMTFVLSKTGRHALLNVATQVCYIILCYTSLILCIIHEPLSLLEHYSVLYLVGSPLPDISLLMVYICIAV